ncbi:MAG: 16S rRNA (uracil(1498)-N(3))-methyltransferase [Defluviimonas sp.]|uniref:16S rRNA (uracil(1498)-N(3))-methyltransferase n=1 Tax=Albidovulum sp. TaxID=1872424 RepID=UPI001E056720|nr:16S rRNA (uracil(1498)-N(3))-methyltransferase [Paracoccaceae bacterium]MCC0065128.1 16S rRNA (uracil(1498)-N(3))-methyltransferase [Defluviimonas sp.]
MAAAKIRLCVDQPLGPGQSVPLSVAQAHYLFGVMRTGEGSAVLVFNGRDGEWLAEVSEAGRGRGALACRRRVRPQVAGPDLWLLFAPVKKARTDFIVEKAVELGVARILPVLTERTNSERFRRDKAEAHVREAAEQCGALCLPEVAEAAPLDRVLAGWDPSRHILWADEAEAGAAVTLAALPDGPGAVLVGPEGGFSGVERARLGTLPFVHAVALGPRILRAETAALAALTLWQAARGDWR